MIKLNKNTNKAKNFMRAYINSTNHRLDDCYKNYSYAKASAFDYCINKQNKMEGRIGRIIGYNIFFFSYAFVTDTSLIVICPTNEYEIQL